MKKQLKQKLIDEIILSISSLVDMDKTQKSKMVDMYKENIYIIKEGEYLLGKITYWVIKIFGLKNVSRLLHTIKIIRRKIIY